MKQTTVRKRLLLVDLSAVFWRGWHATKDMELGSAFETTLKKVRWLASGGYDGVGICCDAPPYWRKSVAPEYKAQRDTPDPAAVDQLRRAVDRLAADGFQIWKAPSFEADDVIASAALWAVNEGHHVHVASGDKDLLALVSEGLQFRNTSTDEIFDVAKVVEKFGVKPWQMPSYLALVGDTSDNVKGVQGVGSVKARELVTAYESVPQLLAALRAGVVVGKPATHAALKAAQLDGSLDKALQLVTLRVDVEGIEWNQAFAERQEKPLENAEVNAEDFDEPSEPATVVDMPPTKAAEEKTFATVHAMTNAIVQNQPSYSTALEPRSARDAFNVAKSAVAARVFGIANPDTAFAMILRGRAMGLDSITSLTAFHIIKDKLTLSANIIEGMVMRSPECEYFMCSESTDKTCTWITKRRGCPKEQSHTWSIADAERMGLLRPPAPGKEASPWMKNPRTMLRHRCATDFARLAYADVIAGLYSTEEMDDQ